MKKDSFFKGAFLMVASCCAVKLGGALFKVPLSSLLTGRGMGLFMASYSIFNPFYSLFVSAISPSTAAYISKIRAQKGEAETEKVGRAGFIFFLFYSASAYFLFTFIAPYLTKFTGEEELLPCIYAIAPCILFCSAGSYIKGWFEGNLSMMPTALSNLAEVFAKFILGIALASFTLEKVFSEFYSFGSILGEKTENLNFAICKAIPLATIKSLQGVSAASFISCTFLLVLFLLSLKGKEKHLRMYHFKASFGILKRALPICLSSLIISLYPAIDMYTFMKLFKSLFKDTASLPKSLSFLLASSVEKDAIPAFLYGCYSGLAMTVFHIVPSLTSSFSVAVLPLVSSCYAGGRERKTEIITEGIIRVVAFMVFPLGLAMLMMPREILLFFFGKSPLEVEASVSFLKILGPASVFVGLTSPVFAVLQGIGREKIPAKTLFYFLWVKLLFNVLLTFCDGISPFASALSTLISYILIFFFSLKKLSSLFNRRFSFFKTVSKPFLLSFTSCLLAKVTFLNLSKHLQIPSALAVSATFGAFIYIILTSLTGEFKQEYIKFLYRNKNA